MLKNYSALTRCGLFTGIAELELDRLLLCLRAVTKEYCKGEYILYAGDPVTKIGLILSGSVQILREDEAGEKEIVSELSMGGLFAETLCCAGVKSSPVSVLSAHETQVMFLDYKKVLKTCPSSCSFHSALIQNLLQVMARKNMMLHDKINLLSKKTTREKLISYFHQQSLNTGTNVVTIPFNREELADYLSINRSAMSRELSNMKKEGLIHFDKNHFHLFFNEFH